MSINALSQIRQHGPGLLRNLISLISACLIATSHAAVSHCQDDAGRTHFRQFDCPPGMIRIEQPTTSPLSIVRTAPLSEAEQRALKQLEQTLTAARRERARAGARASKQRSAQRLEKKNACLEANQRLDQLADTRRKGYQAKAEARLEAEEARWQTTRKANC